MRNNPPDLRLPLRTETAVQDAPSPGDLPAPGGPPVLAAGDTAPAAAKPSSLVIIAMASFTILGLEFTWTRIFSAEFYYSFAFLMLSLAILGLGLGALALRLVPALGRDRCLGPVLALCGGATLAGPPLVFKLGLDFSRLLGGWNMIGRLLGAVALLASAYFFGGLAIAALLRRECRSVSRLYMADLFGAGLGVVLTIVLMNLLGTPVATVVIAVPALAAALLVSRGLARVFPVMLLIAAGLLAPYAGGLLRAPREERAPVVYEHWDATAKIKIYQYGEQSRGINIDNAANSPVYAFDGNWNRPAEKRFRFGIDVSNLIRRFDSCTFLSLGAGGGGDVLQALQAGAKEVHAVEVNPHINRMMLTGVLADFTGHLYSDPRVHVVTEDGRIYARRHKRKFHMIYALSANTFAALSSGSFALAENYLFTTEALRDYWDALTDDGFMMMEHQYFVPRLVPSLLDALAAAEVDRPEAHFAVYELPRMRRRMILLSRRPLTDDIRQNAFGELTAARFKDIHLVYPAPDNRADNLINRIVTEGWRSVASSAPVNIAPCTDDRPFIGQMGRWANVHWERPKHLAWSDVGGYPAAQMILVVLLLITAVLVMPLNLLPLLRRSDRLRAVPWLYFSAIGAAFMAVEVVLIQKYTLFVGPSAHSVATVLTTMLVAAGVGSRWSATFKPVVVFGGIIAWLLVEGIAFRHVTGALTGLPAGARILVTGALLAPLGFLMGMPFPKGALRVGALVDWAFAVNGAASVLGAAAVLLVAMTFGFRVALLGAAMLYGLAWLLMARTRSWPAALEAVPAQLSLTNGPP